MLTSNDLSTRFQQLDHLLTELRPLWQFRPFAENRLPTSFPTALQSWLLALEPSELKRLAGSDTARVAALKPFIPQAERLHALCSLEQADRSAGRSTLPARLSYHIPGRKWTQIQAFEQALSNQPERPFLEWCAGKGHLGRLLAHCRQQPVDSLEWQPQLCHEGQQLADTMQLPLRSHCVDVMTDEVLNRLAPRQHAVALHACGKLHLRLLKLVCKHQLSAVTLSPCCYHLIDEAHYCPLSHQGSRTALTLSHLDLKLALQDTVTAGQREQRLRERELSWRLGFDRLQRHLRRKDEYLPCPSAPKKHLSGTFPDYCHWAAERKGLTLPPELDFTPFEQDGMAQIPLIERMELVRQLFRRPLEIWLALDRAVYLQECGYQVSLTTFCDYQLTPRNLLIRAVRQQESV